MSAHVPSRARDAVALALFVAAMLAVGAIGSIATSSSVETWYPTLTQPPLTPPSAVFGPVWTVLYVTLAISVWRFWRLPATRARRAALILFTCQLVLNLAWSFLFFGARSPLLGLVDIVVLMIFIVATMRAFWPLDRPAALLLVPYALWVGFATYLNAGFVVLN